ncbi:glycerophosphodiester phosphodiesterase [Streptococcus sp. DD12]|uniref:glycerophosphodiester phosphodiesterase n=1 Tax=Streptococcus sp. DD12 TaxID=1777880 RepID=UPI0007919077|nr:glycerophosphodiester phosphodiesterase [Streptococcus sp. DD12]KXT75744.1 Glycerophosphoryl diester phosphodiesterase [Streptococcus sp. DD12]
MKNNRTFSVVARVLTDLYRHRFTYLLRASLLHLVIVVGGVYGLSLLLRMILIGTNLPGLTIDNLRSFLVDPVAVGLLMVYLLTVALLLFIEFSALALILQVKEDNLRSHAKQWLWQVWTFFKGLLGRQFFAFVGYLLLTIPVLQFFLPSALLQNIYIPTFIADNMTNTVPRLMIYLSLYALVVFLNFRFLYTLPLSVLHPEERFSHLMGLSWRKTRGKAFWSTLLPLGVLVGFWSLLGLLVALVLVFGLILLGQLFNEWVDIISSSITWGILFAGNILSTLATLSFLLNQLDEDAQPTPKGQSKAWHKWGLVLLISLIGGVNLVNAVLKDEGSRNKNQVIIAHRGDVGAGVENSIPSLKAAAKAKADYSELDVILSQDGEFVVSHDDNVRRLTGVNRDISQSKASQVIGLKTHQNGHQAQLVSLKTYIATAKSLGIKLLIELKPPEGADLNRYATSIVSLLKAEGVEKNFLVMSLNLPLMEKVEALDPAIQTGYTISFQLGDFTSQKVDFYAIEDFSYRSALAKEAHRQGKKVYVWTINESDLMSTYFNGKSDGIITDYPSRAYQERANVTDDKTILDTFFQNQ